MMIFQVVCLFIGCSLLTNDGVANGERNGKLLSVVVLYRHGDRAPIGSYPNDPYHDEAYWPDGLGQLLNAGKRRHYKLGRFFRSRYSSFLSGKYSYKDIYVLSSDVDRTLMSAASNLAGMFVPRGEEIWNEHLLWQPIPIHTLPQSEDALVSMSKDCPKYQKLFDQVSKSKAFTGLAVKYADFFKVVSKYTTWNITDVDTFKGLYTVFYIYKMHNSAYLPSWYYKLDQQLFGYLAGLSFTKETFTEDLSRLKAGQFFNYILQHFDDVMEKDHPKFLMISGHDGTVAAALNSMGVYDLRPPEFASTVIWELRANAKGRRYVNVYYKRNSTEDARGLIVDGCSFDCNLDQFKKKLHRIAINAEDWEKECHAI